MKPKPYIGEIVTRGEKTARYERIGFCGFCVLSLEALSDGSEVRHVETKIPYGKCPQALKSKKEKA